MNTQSLGALGAHPASAEPADDPDGMKEFVEHYLAARGYHLSSRNARLVVATVATCRAADLDWSALEQHVDAALDRERLRPAA